MYSHDKTYVIAMDSTVHAHMITCGFKREQVIHSDNLSLSEVMFGKRCGARVRGHPHGRFQDSKRDFLWSLAGGITPRQFASIHKIFTRNTQEFPRFSQESHKKSTRITMDFHKNYPRITQESHKNFTSPQHSNPAEITSVFHAKTLEYVCHTGRTHKP